MATRIALVCRQQKVGEVVMGRAGGQPQTAHVPMVPPSLVCRLQSYEQGRSSYSGLAAAGVLSLETWEDVTPQVSWLCCARPSGKTE